MANETKKPALYLAEYDTPNALAAAAMKVRDAGYQSWDCHTPYPMHGMDEAMGLKPTRIGIISFAFGMFGVALAVFMMQYTNALEWNLLNIGAGYPIVVGGKPPGAFPSMVPIMFELTVLFSALAAVFGMFALNKMPQPYNPLFYSRRFAKVTDDGFFISIESRDGKFEMNASRKLLYDLGAVNVEVVEDLEYEES